MADSSSSDRPSRDSRERMFYGRTLTHSERLVIQKIRSHLGENADEFVYLAGRRAISAPRQLKKRIEKVKSGFVFLRAFFPYVHRLLTDASLEHKGYLLDLKRGDAPLSSGIIVRTTKGVDVGQFSFDLFFNRDRKPSIVLGNFQGKNRGEVVKFKQAIGKSPLDYFVARVNRAFPTSSQRVALNPQHHSYRRGTATTLILARLVEDGVISLEELSSYNRLDAPLALTEKIDELLAEARERIKRETTGMHRAAYKHGGYKLTRSRFFRTKK